MQSPGERRSEPRLKTNAPVIVRLLGAGDSTPMGGSILEISGRGLLVSVASPAACGTPVRIEGEDTLLLGEICRVEHSGEQWKLAVRVRHRLKGLAELARLNRALLGSETTRPEPAPAPFRVDR